MAENEPVRKSIVDEKYKDMRGASDWIGRVLEEAALTTGVGAKPAVAEVKDAEGNVTQAAKPATKGKDVWDLEAILHVVGENTFDKKGQEVLAKFSDKVNEYIEDNTAHPGLVGQLRMTASNMLRSRARKRGGLYIGGEWVNAPEGFGVNSPLTERPDGTKIAKEKPAKADAEADNAPEDADEGVDA